MAGGGGGSWALLSLGWPTMTRHKEVRPHREEALGNVTPQKHKLINIWILLHLEYMIKESLFMKSRLGALMYEVSIAVQKIESGARMLKSGSVLLCECLHISCLHTKSHPDLSEIFPCGKKYFVMSYVLSFTSSIFVTARCVRGRYDG